jgi:hypothetical protein
MMLWKGNEYTTVSGNDETENDRLQTRIRRENARARFQLALRDERGIEDEMESARRLVESCEQSGKWFVVGVGIAVALVVAALVWAHWAG